MLEEQNKLSTEEIDDSNHEAVKTDNQPKEFYYELALWFYPSFTEVEINEKFNALIKQIEALGGEVLSMELPQLKPLSYEIVGNNNGFWGFIAFELLNSKINELLESLRLDNKSILRHLLTKRRREKAPTADKKPKTHSAKSTKEVSVNNQLNLEELDKKLDALLKG